MKFSEKLQKLRKENNLSQEQLADKLDVSRQSVSKWESGQTYPEMDKLLTMCKLFNITLDDLTNDEVNYKEVKPKNKNTFDNLVDDVMYIIDKTFCMFTNMEPKERGKVISELIILFLVLLFFRLPFEYIISLGNNVIYHFPRGAYILESLWSFMINIIYLILFIFTFLYIYKTYFLDKYKEKEKEEKSGQIKEEKETISETKEEIKVEKKHTIKEKKNKTHSFGTTLFEILGTITSICFKGFLIIMSIPFIISFIALFIALFILIVLLFKGILYFGFVILSIAAIILNWLLLRLIASFLFDYKPKFKFMFTSFIIGLSLTGIGTGLCIFDVANTDIIYEMPENNFKYVTKIYEYNPNQNLVIEQYPFLHNIKYIEDETKNDKIEIEISYYKDLNYIDSYESTYDKYLIVEYWSESRYQKKIIDLFLNNLKDKKIYDYSELFETQITIKSSKNNIEKIKNNYSEYSKLSYNLRNKEISEEYIIKIDNLTNEKYLLNEKINNLENEIYNLKTENEDLKNKIKTYKENLENLITE